jgi:hypothetical protein
MFGNLFDKKDKDKEVPGSAAKEAPSASSSTEGETAAVQSTSSMSSRFKLTGNFFDKRDKDAKGSNDHKAKEGEGASPATLAAEKEASSASSESGSGTTAASSSSLSSSRFKLNLNLGFGGKTSAPVPGTDDSGGAGK